MAFTINTNISASVAHAAVAQNSRHLGTAMEQLSTGRKINSAVDNAAGLAIAERMTSQIKSMAAAITNINDAISMIGTADAALIEITEMLQRMRELAIQAGTDTVSSADRVYLDAEYQEMLLGIDQIVESTYYNGTGLLNNDASSAARTLTFQIGPNANQTATYLPGTFVDDGNQSNVGAIYQKAPNILSGTLHTGVPTSWAANNFEAAVKAIDGALTTVERTRSRNGTFLNSMEFALDNLTTSKINLEASRSRILDTDYAEATSELARTQIIQQAGMAMIAQANSAPNIVMMLLRG
jgi:flagellin